MAKQGGRNGGDKVGWFHIGLHTLRASVFVMARVREEKVGTKEIEEIKLTSCDMVKTH